MRVMPHFVEITRWLDKIDNRKLTMFCTNGILWSLALVNGPMFQEEATEIAKRLAKPEYADFKASSGWLEK